MRDRVVVVIRGRILEADISADLAAGRFDHPNSRQLRNVSSSYNRDLLKDLSEEA